jgi:hypothetical protein
MYLTYAINCETLELIAYNTCETENEACEQNKENAFYFANTTTIYDSSNQGPPGFYLAYNGNSVENKKIINLYYKSKELIQGILETRYHIRFKRIMFFSIQQIRSSEDNPKINNTFKEQDILPPLKIRMPLRTDEQTMGKFKRVMDELKQTKSK